MKANARPAQEAAAGATGDVADRGTPSGGPGPGRIVSRAGGPGGPDRDVTVVIQTMRRRHLSAVRRIDAAVYPRPWSLAMYHQELGRPDSRRYVVARVDGRIAGYAGLMMVAGEGHVTSVAVDPRTQGCGVGTRLVLALCRWSILAGASALTLEVREGNTRAQELYTRFGFVPAGIRKGYYTDNRENAVVMWRHDVADPEFPAMLREIEDSLPGNTRWEQQ